MAEPDRQSGPNAPQSEAQRLDLRRRTTSETINSIPVVGGAKMIVEAAAGRELDGTRLEGRNRTTHAALGASNVAMGFTHARDGREGAAGRDADTADRMATGLDRRRMRGAATRMRQAGSFMRSNPELTRRGEEYLDRRVQEHRNRPRPSDSGTRSADAARAERARTQASYKNEVGGKGYRPQASPDVLAAVHHENEMQALGIVQMTIRKTFDHIDSEFHKKGEKFDEADLSKIINENPPAPPFPVVIISLALLKDIIDVAGNLTLVGIILTVILSFMISIILMVWSWGKMGGWWWKKYIIKWLWTRFVLAVAVEFVPFVQIVPATTILVLMTHYHEKKLVKLFNYALETMHEAGILKYIK